MTLLARDEEDIVDAQLRYHLENGVDFVIATDHCSVDGTTDVLRRYEREGVLHLIRESSEKLRQAEWVTRMARLAAAELGADWVVNSDADEFLWPRDGTLREVLEAVPARFGVVHGFWRHFVMRPETGEPFFERMIVRTRPSTAPASPYVGALKAIHRGDREAVVGEGNHKVQGPRLVPLREWTPLEVLHFPIRTRAQLERKFRCREENTPPDIGLARHVAATIEAFDAHGVDTVASGLLVDDAALEEGLAKGMLVMDVRLCAALRGVPVSEVGGRLDSIEDDVVLAAEAARFTTSDSITKLSWRLDGLRQRAGSIDRAAVLLRRRTEG